MTHTPARVASFALLAGCTPGELWVDGDREVLRTALVRTEEVDGVAHASVVLSNGLFACDLPRHDNPARAQQALQNLVTSACRQGAHHLTLQLWRGPDGDWTGTYPGRGGSGPADLAGDQPRVADAIWYSADDVFLANLPDLDRAYFVEDRTLLLGASDGGEVEVTQDGPRFDGHAWLPEIDAWVSFSAEVCSGRADGMRLIDANPGYVCEI